MIGTLLRHSGSTISDAVIETLRRTGMLFLVPLALITVLSVIALRPLVVIRFGALPANTIGSLTVEMELYLCEQDAGINNRRAIDIFYCHGVVVNPYLKKMWSRVLHVFQLAHLLDRLSKRLPASSPHQVPWRRRGSLDIYGLLARTEPHLTFTDGEERLGQIFLREAGLPDGAPFICFHARDQAYVATVMPEIDQTNSIDHNINVQDFLPAIEALASRGNYGLRMGAIVQEKLPPTGPMIVDYANRGRTDFLDIYLHAKCRFFLGCASGIIFIPMTFRRPVVLTNFVVMDRVPAWSPDYLFIPKKLWSAEKQRLLTYREMLELLAIGGDHWVRTFAESGITGIDNSPEEITAVAIEMDRRLDGTWESSEEDEELQKRFWARFQPTEWNRFYACRIGTEFLRQNQDLLE